MFWNYKGDTSLTMNIFFIEKAMYTQKLKQKNGRKCKRNKANIKKSKAKQNKVFITKTN